MLLTFLRLLRIVKSGEWKYEKKDYRIYPQFFAELTMGLGVNPNEQFHTQHYRIWHSNQRLCESLVKKSFRYQVAEFYYQVSCKLRFYYILVMKTFCLWLIARINLPSNHSQHNGIQLNHVTYLRGCWKLSDFLKDKRFEKVLIYFYSLVERLHCYIFHGYDFDFVHFLLFLSVCCFYITEWPYLAHLRWRLDCQWLFPVCVCVYVCVCLYIYIYIYTYTQIIYIYKIHMYTKYINMFT